MAITAVNPISSELSIDESFHRTYTSVYEVITDARTTSPIAVVNAAGIPEYRSSYVWQGDIDLWAFAATCKASLREQKDTCKTWRVTITHSTMPVDRSDDTPLENPLDEPPKISGGSALYQKPVDQDRNGNALVNPANEPFIPALVDDAGHDTVIVEVNTADIDLEYRNSVLYHVNDDSFWGLGARELKLLRWDWVVKYWGNNNLFITNRLEFKIDTENFNHRPLLQATRKIVGVDDEGKTQYEYFRDKNDELLKHPIPVKEDGTPLEPDDPAEFADFEVTHEADFSALPVPDPLF